MTARTRREADYWNQVDRRQRARPRHPPPGVAPGPAVFPAERWARRAAGQSDVSGQAALCAPAWCARRRPSVVVDRDSISRRFSQACRSNRQGTRRTFTKGCDERCRRPGDVAAEPVPDRARAGCTEGGESDLLARRRHHDDPPMPTSHHGRLRRLGAATSERMMDCAIGRVCCGWLPLRAWRHAVLRWCRGLARP